MSPRLYVLALGLLLQVPLVLAWGAAFWSAARSRRGHTPEDGVLAPGATTRRAGLVGGCCGLAYAVMAHDPVFFLGQAIFLGLSRRTRFLPAREPDDTPGTR